MLCCISLQYLKNQTPSAAFQASLSKRTWPQFNITPRLSALSLFPQPNLRYLSEQCVVNVVIVVTSVKYWRLVLNKFHAFLASSSHPSPYMSLSASHSNPSCRSFFMSLLFGFFLLGFLSYSWGKIICFFDHHRARRPSRSPRNAKTKNQSCITKKKK